MVKDELRSPETLKRIGELKSTDNSWLAIQRKLESELGIKAGVPAIKNAYNIYSARSSEIIAGDESIKGALKEAVLDTSEQLKEINEEMRNLVKKAKTGASDKISASKEILNQLYFQEKLLNRIQQGFDWGKINKIEYTKISANNLEELEKSGYIKILKKPGEEAIDVDKIRDAEFKDKDDYIKKEEVNKRLDKFHKIILELVGEENKEKLTKKLNRLKEKLELIEKDDKMDNKEA